MKELYRSDAIDRSLRDFLEYSIAEQLILAPTYLLLLRLVKEQKAIWTGKSFYIKPQHREVLAKMDPSDALYVPIVDSIPGHKDSGLALH